MKLHYDNVLVKRCEILRFFEKRRLKKRLRAICQDNSRIRSRADAREKYETGVHFFQAGNLKDAARCFSEAITLNCRYISAYRKRAEAYEKLDVERYRHLAQQDRQIADRLIKENQLISALQRNPMEDLSRRTRRPATTTRTRRPASTTTPRRRRTRRPSATTTNSTPTVPRRRTRRLVAAMKRSRTTEAPRRREKQRRRRRRRNS